MIRAIYEKIEIDELKGNPLIESIFSSLNFDTDQLINKLYKSIVWNENLSLDSQLQIKLQIKEIRELFLPFPNHVKLYSKISLMILNSYKKRNPMCADVIKERYQKAMGNEFGAQDYSTLLISGHSGTGKSRSVESIINLIGTKPIIHNCYYDEQFTAIQIISIKVSIGADGSIKGLLYEILKEFDAKLGTKYFEKALQSRINTVSLINQVASLTWMHFVGVILIDEVQYAYKHIKSLLGFITTFVNKVNIPIVFIGTPDFMDSLSDFAVARRISTEGIIKFGNFINDEEYEYLLHQLFKYQFIKPFIQVNKEILKTFYDKTYGNMDLTIKLYSKILENQADNNHSELNLYGVDEAYNEDFEALSRIITSTSDLSENEVKKSNVRQVKDTAKPSVKIENSIKYLIEKTDYENLFKLGRIDDLEWCLI